MVNAPIDRATAALEQMRGYLEEAGRDPDDFGIDARVSLGKGVEVAVEQGRRWRELGISHLTVNPLGAGLGWPWGHVDAIRRFKAAWDGG
jgi:alkanesulfonate monooxygenase SsuD/methylene tetrahydromethanopterin reductase-like flavin-dependent oxidoreductase (luciferase family)